MTALVACKNGCDPHLVSATDVTGLLALRCYCGRCRRNWWRLVQPHGPTLKATRAELQAVHDGFLRQVSARARVITGQDQAKEVSWRFLSRNTLAWDRACEQAENEITAETLLRYGMPPVSHEQESQQAVRVTA